MKVLTIKQPWATLVAEGLKKYEFRSWKLNYRGEILIHAGKGVDLDAMKKFEHLFEEFLPGGKLEKKNNDSELLGQIDVAEFQKKYQVLGMD